MEKALETIKKYMNKVLSICCSALLIFMTCLVLWQVFTRYILGSPAAFTEELIKYALMWTGFIGAAYAFSTRDHMALTLVKSKLNGTPYKVLSLIIDVLILALALFIITIGGFKLVISAKAEFSALLGISRALVYSVAPISGIFIIIAQVINIYEDIAGIKVE